MLIPILALFYSFPANSQEPTQKSQSPFSVEFLLGYTNCMGDDICEKDMYGGINAGGKLVYQFYQIFALVGGAQYLAIWGKNEDSYESYDMSMMNFAIGVEGRVYLPIKGGWRPYLGIGMGFAHEGIAQHAYADFGGLTFSPGCGHACESGLLAHV